MLPRDKKHLSAALPADQAGELLQAAVPFRQKGDGVADAVIGQLHQLLKAAAVCTTGFAHMVDSPHLKGMRMPKV